MKNITNLTLNKTSLSSSANIINYKEFGEEGAVFSVQVKDNSSPNKFTILKQKLLQTRTFQKTLYLIKF